MVTDVTTQDKSMRWLCSRNKEMELVIGSYSGKYHIRPTGRTLNVLWTQSRIISFHEAKS